MEVLSRVFGKIVRRFLPAYKKIHRLTQEQRKALWAIVACKTPLLGGRQWTCEGCGQVERVYHGCRNRHCPQCQGYLNLKWMREQQAKLLPAGHYHAVFTVARELRPLFAYNRKALYGLLFGVSSQCLKDYAKNPKWLGARPGFIGVLHTWGQQLNFHPHVHYILAGGGLDAQGRWARPKQGGGFLFPVVEMSRRFQERMLASLRRLLAKGQLVVPPGMDAREALKKAADKRWEIFLQPPMKTPDKLLRYLGRYTHRTAIHPSRILEVDEKEVRFAYRDYRQGGAAKTLRLSGVEFLRRFLQHVLPKGFRRVRFYGLFHGSARQALQKAKEALKAEAGALLAALSLQGLEEDSREELRRPCPRCQRPMKPGPAIAAQRLDSS